MARGNNRDERSGLRAHWSHSLSRLVRRRLPSLRQCRSYSAAEALVDSYLTGPMRAEASWRREIVDIEMLVPGFVPVEALGRPLRESK
jgi:hypothetical protein